MDIALLAARRGGQLVRERWPQPSTVELKSDESLVTEIDRGSEACIREILSRHTPEVAVLGEEEGVSGDHGQELWWYVDPVDGTTNLAHRFPWVSISIALLRRGQPEVAVVYNPIAEHLFAAVRGQGATLNGASIRVSSCDAIERSLLATGFPVGPHRHKAVPNLELFARMAPRCHSIRRAGSAALDLACVAAGWFDGFWELGLHAWDSAAGWLLVEEAGGKLSRLDGSAYDPHVPELLASNGRLHATMLEILRG